MAYYRHGRKVPALPPAQRHALGTLTIVLVFALVALATWKPFVFALPAFVAIAGLTGLDQVIVTIRGPEPARPPGSPGPRSAGDRIDGDSVTVVLPRAGLPSPPLPPPPSWEEPALNDPLAVQTMAIDMRALLEDTQAWTR